MRRPRLPAALRGALLTALALTGVITAGCQSTPQPALPAPPPPSDTPSNDRDLAAAVVMADTFQNMQRLTQAAPAEQAEIVSAARDAYQRTPRGETQLRYALLLATPGHPARDAAMAQKLLRELAAQPEALVPIERAVVMVELAQLDHEMDLAAVNQQLQASALRTDRQHNAGSAADQRRLDAVEDENARLRKQVEADQAKLNAIATIERNLTERKTAEPGAPATGAQVAPAPAPAPAAPANEGTPK
ncbi:MAG TPA: hypothetical protein VHY19_00580 [Steroidobacteraceae bacterium]|jgi:hypothetical protein|nr:hypothetical protein [Steroidobacteraceae bacterium]